LIFVICSFSGCKESNPDGMSYYMFKGKGTKDSETFKLNTAQFRFESNVVATNRNSVPEDKYLLVRLTNSEDNKSTVVGKTELESGEVNSRSKDIDDGEYYIRVRVLSTVEWIVTLNKLD